MCRVVPMHGGPVYMRQWKTIRFDICRYIIIIIYLFYFILFIYSFYFILFYFFIFFWGGSSFGDDSTKYKMISNGLCPLIGLVYCLHRLFVGCKDRGGVEAVQKGVWALTFKRSLNFNFHTKYLPHAFKGVHFFRIVWIQKLDLRVHMCFWPPNFQAAYFCMQKEWADFSNSETFCVT